MTNTTNTDTAYASALAYDFEAADKAGNTSNKERRFLMLQINLRQIFLRT